MQVRRRISISGGLVLLIAGAWLGTSTGHEWTASSTTGVLAFMAGVAVVWQAIAFPPFDADLDRRLREGAGAGIALSGWVHLRRRLPRQCIVLADTQGLTVITASGSMRTEWTSVKRISGGLGGRSRPLLIVRAKTSQDFPAGCALRLADQSALQELAAVTPAGVRWRVRMWGYTRPLAVARWSLVVLTTLWAITFAIVMVAAGTWLLPLSALAAVAAVWASWTAWRMPRLGYAPILSAIWLSAYGLLPAVIVALPTPRQAALGVVMGILLSLADLTVLVATLAGIITMPKLRPRSQTAAVTQ